MPLCVRLILSDAVQSNVAEPSRHTSPRQLSDLPLYRIAVTLVLFGAGFIAFHHDGEADEERSDCLQRKWLGTLPMAGAAFSLVITLAAVLE